MSQKHQFRVISRVAVLLSVVMLVLLAASPLAAQQNTYVVQPGDTLARIASQFGTTVAALQSANNIANPNRIFVGQVLVLPVAVRPTTYTVQPGDNLAAIAARYNVTLEALLAINNITAGTTIRPGQVLTLPATGGQNVPVGQTYTVQRGDTLSSIASRFGTTVSALQSVNYLANLSRIYPGQVLNIPATGGQTPTTPPTGGQPQPQYPTTYNGYYYVQYGDTLLGIASWFGVDAWTIARANGIYNLNHIYAGLPLFIPGR
jgi:LysM repeat protein